MTWMNAKDTSELRRILASKRGGYYKIEQIVLHGKQVVNFSSRDRAYVPIDLDFYELDRLWMQRLMEAERWDPELLATTLYDTMMNCWRDYPLPRDSVRYFVSMDSNYRETPEFLLENTPGGKLLYMVRLPAGVVATLGNRRAWGGNPRSGRHEQEVPFDFAVSGDVRGMLRRCGAVEALARLYPDRVKIVDFADLIEKTRETMKEIASFLQIPFRESLTVFSQMGEEVTTESGMKYVGKIHDRPEDMLSPAVRFLIALQENPRRCLSSQALEHPLMVLLSLWMRNRRFLPRQFSALVRALRLRV